MSKKFEKIIIVEGHDGTGKSTLCQRAIKHLQCDFIKFPTVYPDWANISTQEAIDFHIADFQTGLGSIEPTSPILLCDRAYLSTLAYQCFDEDNNQNEHFLSVATKCSELFSDFSDDIQLVMIESSLKVATQRILTRDHTGQKDPLDEIGEVFLASRILGLKMKYRVTASYLNSQRPKVFTKTTNIDTTNLSKKQTLESFKQQVVRQR